MFSQCFKIQLFATEACYNLSFTFNSVMVCNIALSWFSPWTCVFNSLKWAVKTTTNAKSVSHFSSSISSTDFPFIPYTTWFHFANHKILLAFYLGVSDFRRGNYIPIIAIHTFKEFLELVMFQSLRLHEIHRFNNLQNIIHF